MTDLESNPVTIFLAARSNMVHTGMKTSLMSSNRICEIILHDQIKKKKKNVPPKRVISGNSIQFAGHKKIVLKRLSQIKK